LLGLYTLRKNIYYFLYTRKRWQKNDEKSTKMCVLVRFAIYNCLKMGAKRTSLGAKTSLAWGRVWVGLLPSKRFKKAAKREKKGRKYRGKAGRESEVGGGQKRCKWLGVNDGVVNNGRGETSAYGGKGVARRREPKGEQQGERDAGEIQKRRTRMNLLSVFVPQAGLAS
jgi:hypothetical protein